ncbi:hypothetical protein IIV30_042L [Invertebrate iridescent virus 30]|uniref:Uncharacterized protein n=1 Tax=Invertebrate iridescent virus 30 TaxID=345585 RepID=W8W1P9_9VIRU|nr:hypothetical protein IIV30_042L [Invertebrate iridescent virus 30]CCV02237.1 hypothetical protein IIV30_042L [Invertebrate iridescent virus 30]
MPRDKKTIHRATSDVEDEVISDEEDEKPKVELPETKELNKEGSTDLSEERKKFLKEAILKRTQTLKQQRERDRQQRINSTKY